MYTETVFQGDKKYVYTFTILDTVVCLDKYVEYRLQLPRTWIPDAIFQRTPVNGYDHVGKHVLQAMKRHDVFLPAMVELNAVAFFRNRITFE